VILEESQRIQHTVADDHGSRRILSAWNRNLEFQISPLARLVIFQVLKIIIRDAQRLNQERVIQALRIRVLDGNRAIDPVVGADEFRFDDLGDFDCPVAFDGDLRVEALDRILPRSDWQTSE
jgi:hypothetical protein